MVLKFQPKPGSAISQNETRGKYIALLCQNIMVMGFFWHLPYTFKADTSDLEKECSSQQQSSCFPSWHPLLPPSICIQLGLISLDSGLVWILPLSHLRILSLTHIWHATGLWPILRLNLAYWFAETDAHLRSAALVWIKTISCIVLLSWADLSCLLPLHLTSHCITAETCWISVFPQVTSVYHH